MTAQRIKLKAGAAPLPRPICPYCGKQLAKATEYHWFKAGDEPNTKEECRRRFNGELVSVKWSMASRYLTPEEIAAHGNRYPSATASTTTKDETRPRVIYACSVWTGGYGSYGGFCTLRCAADFGVAAYRAGYRVTR
jgi:hypothetical protein